MEQEIELNYPSSEIFTKKPNYKLNYSICFFLGLITGIILIIILMLILKSTNSVPFNNCYGTPAICRSSQYFNNPTNALRNGSTLSEILTINNNNQMQYKRPPREPCSPGENQEVTIVNPQYCTFTNSDGSVLYRDMFFDANLYYKADGSDLTDHIVTSGNCVPLGTEYTSGQINLRWD